MKKYNLKKTTLFEAQLDQQLEYYFYEAGIDIANKFLDEVDESLNKIAEMPLAYSQFIPVNKELKNSQFHKKQLRNFPFTIFFQVNEESVLINCIYQEAVIMKRYLLMSYKKKVVLRLRRTKNIENSQGYQKKYYLEN